jgi:NodT family efflux transporter outer membrane factor (OMF) lipoprotein
MSRRGPRPLPRGSDKALMHYKSALCLLTATLAACAVGPNYHRPPAPTPQHFKEADGWKPAEPREAASGTPWWSVYDDAVLDDLEKQVDISNQTLKQSEAAWRQAMAITSAARAQLLPTIGVTGQATRARGASSGISSGASASSGANGGAGGTTTTTLPNAQISHPFNEFELEGTASWALDIWGKIRRTIESDVANAQMTEAELAAARLSAQGTLATDYVELRVADEQKALLDQTVEAYQRSLQITENQYKAGIVAKTDVITAQTQLQGAQSQDINIGVTRATLEHAIAVLVGKPPADFSIAAAKLGDAIPVAPSGLPSTLLERRPDIAQAERNMQAENALVGVAEAAYFPSLTLQGSYGFASSVTSRLVSAPNSLWSVGANVSETVIDFGARSAQVREAKAAYDGAVASYRQTVLTAFQQVEDELATLRILEQQFKVQEEATESADLAVQLTLNQYKAGTVAYTSVVTAQTIALTDATTLLTIRQSRLTASVALIQALGGGWQASSLDTPAGTAAQLSAQRRPAD